jgi:gas vesicle protein
MMMNERTYYSKEAEERVQRERTMAVLVFMALGLGIGAALALMFAPKRGDQLRKELVDSVEDSVDGGRESAGKAVKRLEKDLGDLRKKVEERIENIR